MSSLSNSQVRVQGPEIVYGSIYDQIGYSAIEEPMFRHLVVCRLFSPGSKLKTIDYLQRYLHVSVPKHNIYNFVLIDNGYLSALVYFAGLMLVLVIGFFFQKFILWLTGKITKPEGNKADTQ